MNSIYRCHEHGKFNSPGNAPWAPCPNMSDLYPNVLGHCRKQSPYEGKARFAHIEDVLPNLIEEES